MGSEEAPGENAGTKPGLVPEAVIELLRQMKPRFEVVYEVELYEPNRFLNKLRVSADDQTPHSWHVTAGARNVVADKVRSSFRGATLRAAFIKATRGLAEEKERVAEQMQVKLKRLRNEFTRSGAKESIDELSDEAMALRELAEGIARVWPEVGA